MTASRTLFPAWQPALVLACLPWLLCACQREAEVAHPPLQSQQHSNAGTDVQQGFSGAGPGEASLMAGRLVVPPMPPTTPQDIAAGHTLFVRMNCAGCHTYTGKGWMGPDLTDSYWRYGDAPQDIYRVLYEGRPQGMPAWGKKLSSNELWQLVMYIRSLPTHPGGDPTTDSPANGTGYTVDSVPPGPDASAGEAAGAPK